VAPSYGIENKKKRQCVAACGAYALTSVRSVTGYGWAL